MTECARCGDCCDPVFLRDEAMTRMAATYAEAQADRFTNSELAGAGWSEARLERVSDARWAVESLTKIGPDPDSPEAGSLYRCVHFDADTRLCAAHDARPPICSNFPWYGGEPYPRGLSLRCSFWADVPEDQRPNGWVPVTVAAAPAR